jgi:hypothetical protein
LKARYVTDGGARSKPTVSGDVNASRVSLPDQDLDDVSREFRLSRPVAQDFESQGQDLGRLDDGRCGLSIAPNAQNYDFDIDVKNAALKEISSVGKLVQGRGDLSLKGKGQGFDRDLFVKTLRGNGNLNVREVRVPR